MAFTAITLQNGPDGNCHECLLIKASKENHKNVLKEELGQAGITEDVLKLESLLNDYDFDEARSAARRISKVLIK